MAEAKAFIGERQDDETGLLDLDARYYDPALARFIQADPSNPADAGVGVNRYAYAGNSPVMLLDPTGSPASRSSTPMSSTPQAAAVRWRSASISLRRASRNFCPIRPRPCRRSGSMVLDTMPTPLESLFGLTGQEAGFREFGASLHYAVLPLVAAGMHIFCAHSSSRDRKARWRASQVEQSSD